MQVWCGSEMPEETYGDCKSLLLLFCFSSCLRLVTPVHCLLRRSESAIAVRSLLPFAPSILQPLNEFIGIKRSKIFRLNQFN